MNDLDISRLQSLGIATQPRTQESSELGQDDFLRIMLAQLENQDPTSPLEGNEFLSQITQFSIAEGVSGLNDSFSNLTNSLTSNQALQASALVGRSVLVPGDTAELSEGRTLQGRATLLEGANSVTVDIFNQGGELVNTLHLGPQSAGNVDFTWDGLTNGGTPAEQGAYRVIARANVGGTEQALSTLISARVDSVTLQNGGGSLEVNLAGIGPVSFSSVVEIR